VLSSVVLLLLRDHLPPGVTSLDSGGLGQLLDRAGSGKLGAGVVDLAFQRVMLLSAGISMLSLWFVTWLPDLRLHDAATVAQAAVAEV